MTSTRNLNIQFLPTGIFKASTRDTDCLQKFLECKIDFLYLFSKTQVD